MDDTAHRPAPTPPGAAPEDPFWSRAADALLRELDATTAGLTEAEVDVRRERFGANRARPRDRHPTLRLLAGQFRSPIAILLAAAALLSGFVGEVVDAAIILGILLGSALLAFWQERRAAGVVEELLALIRTTARVRRAGHEAEVPLEELVPGDIVLLRAGDLVPADCRILEARDLDVDEAVLSGEAFPVSKDTAATPPDAPTARRTGALFQGTHVVSGTATALVVHTGRTTLFGRIAGDLDRRRPESEFERGVRRFGYLLLEITAALVLVVFAINVALDRAVLDVFLFSLALAVGLTPQLLPAIVSITLSYGARRMAQRAVIVRRLVAIEDFGGMQVLCTDKTGTLTEGAVRLRATLDADGAESAHVRRLAWLNATHQTGYDNPIDAALRAIAPADGDGARKLDEVPYDFARRRLSVLLEEPDGRTLLVTKGAVASVLQVCDEVDAADTAADRGPAADWRAAIERRVTELGAQGARCLAVAWKPLPGARTATRDAESGMRFAGLLVFDDPVKPGIHDALDRLAGLGIAVRMVTGDGRAVAAAVARTVGLDASRIVTGTELARTADGALDRLVRTTAVFAEVDPNQKVRVIRALRRTGASVGCLGDGINDAPALRAADVGISVDTAVDVTRRAADVVLLRKDLDVLAEGVEEGRRAFANTLKYVFITTSANFGNMLSMAIASMFAAFLPMLPKQILLLNLLSDLPAMTIATDRLDPELVARPRRWDVPFIRDFMITFGVISSCVDLMMFGVLLLLEVPVAEFRTAWFTESVLTEIFVLLVIRTSRVFFRSPPSPLLVIASIAVAALTLALPYLPAAGVLGFAPLPPSLLAVVLALTLVLVVASELAKRAFFARHAPDGGAPGAAVG